MTSTGARPRSAAGRVTRNSGIQGSSEVLSKLFSLVFFALIARELGGAALGDYVFALAITSLIWSFAGLGLDRMAMRDFARDPAASFRVVVPFSVFKFAAALTGTLVCALALSLLTDNDRRVELVILLGVSIALSLGTSSVQAVFAAAERMEYVFLAKVPAALVVALAGIAAILLGGGIVTATAASALGGGVLGAAWAYYLLVRYSRRPEFRLRVREWPGMLRGAVPFGLQEALGQVIFRFDTVLLALLTTSTVVGAYGAAFRMLESALFITWSIGYAVMPIYSYLDDGRRTELKYVYEGALKLTLLLMAPIAVVFLVCARPIVDLVYGLPEYESTVSVLRLLAGAVAIYGFGHLAGLLVLVRRPGRLTVQTGLVVAVTNVLMCAALIPWLGAEGAAIATVVSELMLAIIGIFLARRLTALPRLGWTLSPLVPAAAMGAVMTPVSDQLVLALPLGALAYLLGLLAVEGRRIREDLRLFRSIAAAPPELRDAEAPATRT